MTDLASRAHMRQQPVVKAMAKSEAVMEPKVERVETERESAYESVGVKDIVWESYPDFINTFGLQSQMGALRAVVEPAPDTSNKHAVINMRIVDRQPFIDDFADMMRKEDFDNHTRLEQYQTPINPCARVDWFVASMLATMIDNGRIGLKVGATGIRELYIGRARTGNIFFRVWGGRVTFLILLAQLFVFNELFKFGRFDTGLLLANIFCFVVAIYHLVHWRFYKRYSFAIGNILVDGEKARKAPNLTDIKLAISRVAIHPIGFSMFVSIFFYNTIRQLSYIGWA